MTVDFNRIIYLVNRIIHYGIKIAEKKSLLIRIEISCPNVILLLFTVLDLSKGKLYAVENKLE